MRRSAGIKAKEAANRQDVRDSDDTKGNNKATLKRYIRKDIWAFDFAIAHDLWFPISALFSIAVGYLDVAPGDGGSIERIRIGDPDFRVQNPFEVVVGVVRLEFARIHRPAVLVGQIAEIRSFANVESELEGLALEAQLLEGVRATIGTLLMSKSFVTDVVVVSDIVAF